MTDMEPATDSERGSALLLSSVRLVESIGKLAGLLAAAGYISMRAHFNFIGVHLDSNVPVQHFLMETWHLVFTTMTRLLWVAVAVGVLAVPIAIAVRLVSVFLRRRAISEPISAGKLGSFRAVLAPELLARFVCLVLFASILAASLVVVNSSLESSSFRVRLELGTWLFDTCVTSVIVLIALRQRSVLLRRSPVITICLLVSAAFLPVLFGIACHGTKYPAARIDSLNASEAPRCGVLVFSNEVEHVLVRRVRQSPRTQVVRRENVKVLTFGDIVDLRSVDSLDSASDCGSFAIE